MDKNDISEMIKAAAEALDLKNFKGDIVMYKHVEKEMNVAEGGIGEKHIHHHYAKEQEGEKTLDAEQQNEGNGYGITNCDAMPDDCKEAQPADEGLQTTRTGAKSTEQSYAEASRLGERPHENKRVNGNLRESDDEAPSKENELCIVLNKYQREILNSAERENIIKYNPERKGYDTGRQSSNVLVAYLCGRLSCGDYTDNDGTWIAGGRFNEAQYYKDLFGFDVDGTRRKARDNGAGKSPTGHERVDKLFE